MITIFNFFCCDIKIDKVFSINTTQMLSQKFIGIINKFLSERLLWIQFDKTYVRTHPHVMTNATTEIFQEFSRLNRYFDNTADTNNFHNYLRNGFLSTQTLAEQTGSTPIPEFYITDVAHINTMSATSKEIILAFLEMMKPHVKFPSKYYEFANNNNKYALYYSLLSVHFNRIFLKIYSVWRTMVHINLNTDIQEFDNYMAKIGISKFNKVDSINKYNYKVLCGIVDKYDINYMKQFINFVESLHAKYNGYDILTMCDTNAANQPVSHASKSTNHNDKYKLPSATVANPGNTNHSYMDNSRINPVTYSNLISNTVRNHGSNPGSNHGGNSGGNHGSNSGGNHGGNSVIKPAIKPTINPAPQKIKKKYSRIELENYTVPGLKNLCEEMDIDFPTKCYREDLVRLITSSN